MKYAFKEGPSNKELRRMYQRRAKTLRRGTGYDFFRGYKKCEQDVIEVLRDLIVGEDPFSIGDDATLMY